LVSDGFRAGSTNLCVGLVKRFPRVPARSRTILQLAAMAGGRLPAGARCTASQTCELHLHPHRLLDLAWCGPPPTALIGVTAQATSVPRGPRRVRPCLLPRAHLRVLHLLHPCRPPATGLHLPLPRRRPYRRGGIPASCSVGADRRPDGAYQPPTTLRSTSGFSRSLAVGSVTGRRF
jgi:hypothetical protein